MRAATFIRSVSYTAMLGSLFPADTAYAARSDESAIRERELVPFTRLRRSGLGQGLLPGEHRVGETLHDLRLR